MNCPYCNNKMILGYVQSSEHIYFNAGEKPRFFAAGDLKSKDLTKVSLKAPNIKGYLCEKCEVIILNIRKEKRNRKNEESLFRI